MLDMNMLAPSKALQSSPDIEMLHALQSKLPDAPSADAYYDLGDQTFVHLSYCWSHYTMEVFSRMQVSSHRLIFEREGSLRNAESVEFRYIWREGELQRGVHARWKQDEKDSTFSYRNFALSTLTRMSPLSQLDLFEYKRLIQPPPYSDCGIDWSEGVL